VQSLFRAVRALREQGVATIFVSHRLKEVYDLVDRITVLRDGVTVGTGSAQELDRTRLIKLMVGRDLVDALPSAVAAGGRPAAHRVRGLSLDDALDEVDLDVAPGEIVGLAGLLGAGRSELLETLFGLRRRSAGSVEVHGKEVRFRAPRDAIRGGLALVPADRKLQGLVLGMTVRENIVMAATSSALRLSPPRSASELPLVDDAIDAMQIRAHSHRALVGTLSGGNQQKVVLGKWLATRPSVLMLDEPTRGVDVGAKSEIYRLIFGAAESGVAVLVSSSENPELITLCVRVLGLFRGRIAATLDRAEATEARIAHAAGGHA
jgi:ABC-type sugar transport system ATPase subunit